MNNESIEELIRQLQELRVQESKVIEKITAATRQQQIEPDVAERYQKTDTYSVGDKVVVNNRVTRPLRAPADWTVFKECRGTVTDVRNDKVFFVTENGTKTWRSKRNLSLILKNE
jgi:hypothetical protein